MRTPCSRDCFLLTWGGITIFGGEKLRKLGCWPSLELSGYFTSLFRHRGVVQCLLDLASRYSRWIHVNSLELTIIL